MKLNNIILILAIVMVGFSCQSIKDGLSGSKSENNDEFLVQKKNPLILPPKYLTLPKPKNSETEEEILQQEEFDIKKILRIKDETVSTTTKASGAAEDFVLKNIKNN